MHTVFALLCFVVVIHWLIFPYPSGLLHWHCGNLTIAPVPAKQPWWIWINTSCEFIMNDCITTTKQSTTKPCAYFLGYTVGTDSPTDNKFICDNWFKWNYFIGAAENIARIWWCFCHCIVRSYCSMLDHRLSNLASPALSESPCQLTMISPSNPSPRLAILWNLTIRLNFLQI